MIVIDAFWTPTILLAALVAPAAYLTFVTPVAATVDIAAACFKIATIILFCRWIYVAGRNLVEADVAELEFTPASRIWWFAVPILSIYKPFQGMRELWNGSRSIYPLDVNHSLVSVWWALWLLSGVIGLGANFIGGVSGGGTTGMWVGAAIDIALAVVAIMLIRGIAEGQSQLDGSSLSEVFA